MAFLRVSQRYIDELLAGDCQGHDITTEGLGIDDVPARVTACPKEAGIVAGIDIAARLFETAGAKVKRLHRDGDAVGVLEPVLVAEGPAQAVHAAYKVAQCAMEYAGGIARRVRAMADAAERGRAGVRVACTRKHFPGTKTLSMCGVLAGGGIMHRLGLSDSILVFDQHRVLCADADAAVRRLIAAEPEHKVCVEVASAEEGLHYAGLGAQIIQCERFTPEEIAAFAKALHEKFPGTVINAAGGVNADNAEAYAAAGADVLVTSWPYFGKPADVKMRFEAL